MSISRGRYVATFARPGYEATGLRSDGPNNFWRVFINQRRGFDVMFLTEEGNYKRFSNLAEAKAWAIARLDELTRERI